MKKILDVSSLTRAEVVPYYTYLIVSKSSDGEVKRMNDLILSKWTASGLLYIKAKAWKMANSLGYTFENGWSGKTLPQAYDAIQSLKRHNLT